MIFAYRTDEWKLPELVPEPLQVEEIDIESLGRKQRDHLREILLAAKALATKAV